MYISFFCKNDTGSANFPPVNPIAGKAMTCGGALPLESPNSVTYIFNQHRLHRAVLPAANGISNAHALARIYALLIGDVGENGEKKTCLLSKKTLGSAIENVTSANETDRVLFGLVTNFARGGFQVHGDFFNVLGEDAFGHKGELVMSIFYSIWLVLDRYRWPCVSSTESNKLLLFIVRHGWKSCFCFTFTTFSFCACLQPTGFQCNSD